MSFQNRLKERRESLNISRNELAKRLGVTASAIGNYENGISTPKADILFNVFDALQCDANYLFQDEMNELTQLNIESIEIEFINKYRSLDDHGKKVVDFILNEEYDRMLNVNQVIKITYYPDLISAGHGDRGNNRCESLEIPANIINPKAHYAIMMRGVSMEPLYCEGDILYVDNKSELTRGEIGIFQIDGCRYVREVGGNGELIAKNQTIADIKITQNVECIGRIIGKIERNDAICLKSELTDAMQNKLQ